jgi:hypothetical protein
MRHSRSSCGDSIEPTGASWQPKDRQWSNTYRISSLGKNTEVHGPCTTTIHGHRVHDMAECLSCTSHPTAVLNWVMRCNKYNWPDSVVLDHCLSLGCQLAPVGSMESPHEDLEWRISFTLMEKTI